MNTPRPKYNDYPFDVIAAECSEKIKQGITIHQKFTCASCGARQAMDEPNKLYTTGRCEECGHVTNIRERGCNYLAIVPGDKIGSMF